MCDDGPGLDPGAARRGTGLVHMIDRLAAVDGELRIDRPPGGGTAVLGWAPTSLRPGPPTG